MKISIVRIKAQDNLNIIIDLLKNALNTRVFLIISEGNDILYSEIGLETLFKKSLELGKELVVSVPNERALNLANSVGLVATLDQDVFTVDFKLWQKAHELLTNYKTKALYDKNYARDPDFSEPSAVNNASLENISNRKDSKLVGQDLSNVVSPVKVKTESSLSKRVNLVSPSGNMVLTKSKSSKPKFGLKLIIGTIFFSLFVLLAFGFWAYYRFFTKVYINLQIPRVEYKKQYTLIAELGVEGADLANKKFALKSYEREQEGTKTAKATKKQQDGTYATGIVNVTNTGTDPIEIQVGQVFTSSDNKQYKATVAVTINPGESKEVNVQAVDFGDSYNLAANQSFIIDGLTGSYTASNPSAFSGGSQREYTIVAEEDVKKALEELKKELIEQAKIGIEDVYKDDGYVIVPNSIKDITPKDERYTLSPKLGEEATEFTIGYKIKLQALYYHKPSLEALLKELMIQDYRKEQKLNNEVKIKLESFDFKIKSIKIKDRKHVQFIVESTASIIPAVDYDALKAKISGLNLEQATNILETDYSSVLLSYRISYIPKWMPNFLQKVPKESGRIIIVTDFINKEAGSGNNVK